MGVGIQEVAAVSGVSATTVSHVLNGKGRVAEATRERVVKAAERLGYRPNPMAQALAGGATGIVAVAASLPGDAEQLFTEMAYYMDIINAATRAAVSRGRALIVAPSGAGSAMWERLPVDGAIVIDPAEGDPKMGIVRSRGLPLVTIGRDPASPDGGLVVENDDRAGTRSVLDHFAERGAQRSEILSWGPFDWFTRESLTAYGSWCSERNLQPQANIIEWKPEWALEMHHRHAARTLLERDDRPDAIYCTFEGIAHALAAEAAARGVRVPDDMMIATTNDFGLAESVNPPLTTLESNQSEMGTQAAEMLLDALDGLPATPSAVVVPTHLVPRASTERSADARI